YALARITGNVSVYLPRLLLAWRDTYDPTEPYPVLSHLLTCLEELGPKADAAVPRMVQYLDEPRDEYSRDNDERTFVVRLLGRWGRAGKAALPILQRLASGEGDLAPLAAEAVRRIEGR